ncbi:MAG: efflux RND transporter permease subunit [Rhodospirillaceae bacterium]|nr:efflux RND transporter permease subunit [Rhodospirillaceae bacterium]
MHGLIDGIMERSRMVMATLAMILVAGVVALLDIPKEAEPDIPVPTIYINMVYRGISPEDGERLLVRPMERQMRTIEGLKEVRGQSYPNAANVTLEFEPGFDQDKAMEDVRAAMNLAKADLPAGAEEPTAHEINMSLLPILAISISGDVPERTLRAIARQLKDKLEEIPSVLKAEIAGDRKEQVEVEIDPALLKNYGIDASQFAAVLRRNNSVVAAGKLENETGAFGVNVGGLLDNAWDVLKVPVVVNGDAVVRVGDLATVRRGFVDATSYARVNGRPSLTIEVSKRIGENIIETVDAAKAVVERERAFWPAGVQTDYFQDKSTMIRDMIGELANNFVTAIILVMIVVVGALGLRSGLLVGLAIPGSFLMGILALYAFGMTINMVVMFALTLAVGMLVDDAIVISEYADRKMVEGFGKREAYAMAAKRMAPPVISATLTKIAAFAPLLFWSGMFGEYMKYLPVTLIATLTASLLMALVFLPVLGAKFGRPGSGDHETMRAIAASEHGDVTTLKGFTGIYARILHKALQTPGRVVLGGIGVLLVVQTLYWSFGKGIEFMPESEPERAAVFIHARGNLSVDEKDALTKEVESRIFDLPEFKSVYAKTGAGARYRDGTADIVGAVQLEYTDWSNRRPSSEVMAEVRERLKDLAGVKVELWEEKMGPPSGREFQINLMSTDTTLLRAHVAKVRAKMAEMGTFTDIEDSLPLPGIDWQLDVDRAQAAKFGVDVRAVGDMVQMVTNGLKMTDYRPNDADDEVDIVVRFPPEYRSLDQLDNLRINTAKGPIPVSNFVRRAAAPAEGEINRSDGERIVRVMANVADGHLANDQLVAMGRWLGEQIAKNDPAAWDRNVKFLFKGQNEEQDESAAFLSRAFVVALFLIAAILLFEFNSFFSTFLICTAVIMSTIGVFLGLLIFQQPFGIVMSGVGVVALAGIIVNNNIVMIDTYDRLKHEFADAGEAALRAAVQRLRPVVLTTVTNILGLLPMMFLLNVDFVKREVEIGAPSLQWWQQLAIAINCGLAFATLLTLVFTPCALKLRADWGKRWGAAWQGGWFARLKDLGRRRLDSIRHPAE